MKHRVVGHECAGICPAIVEWDDEKPDIMPMVTQFSGLEPAETTFFNGVIKIDAEKKCPIFIEL